jgi:hypothetical protein
VGPIAESVGSSQQRAAVIEGRPVTSRESAVVIAALASAATRTESPRANEELAARVAECGEVNGEPAVMLVGRGVLALGIEPAVMLVVASGWGVVVGDNLSDETRFLEVAVGGSRLLNRARV